MLENIDNKCDKSNININIDDVSDSIKTFDQ